MLTYLWKTYQKAPNSKFIDYIQGLQNNYITAKMDFTIQEFMNQADMMYKARNQLKEWSTLSAEQEEIVLLALNAKITHLEQLKKTKDKSSDNNKNQKKPNKKNQDKTKDHEWMKDKPKGDEKKEDGPYCKTVGKKT